MKLLNIFRRDAIHLWLNQQAHICFHWAAWFPWQPKMLSGMHTVQMWNAIHIILWWLHFVSWALQPWMQFKKEKKNCISILMKYNWDVSRSNTQQHGAQSAALTSLLFLPLPIFHFPSSLFDFPLITKGWDLPTLKWGRVQESPSSAASDGGRNGSLVSC